MPINKNFTFQSLPILWDNIIFVSIFTTAILLIGWYINKKYSQREGISLIKSLAIKHLKIPALFLLSTYLFYILFNLTSNYFLYNLVEKHEILFLFVFYLFKLTVLASLFWFTWKVLDIIEYYIQNHIFTEKNTFLSSILPVAVDTLRATFLVIVIYFFIPQINFKSEQTEWLEKIGKLFLISIFGWFYVRVISTIEKLILSQYGSTTLYDPSVRKIKTQVQLLKKIILTIGLVIIFGSMLMIFESVRQLGTGLLTTAGIISAVGAFASQQSLTRIFSGLQLAFTQPIRINDIVIIDNETGEVEEISLSYVVIKLWDLRRLILPTDYIITKGFQNLSRTTTQLLGTVFFYVDYKLPLEFVKKEFFEIANQSRFWDHQISEFNVTEIKEFTLELRAVVSASDGTALWNLRCEIREKLMTFIVKNFPECLPQIRGHITINDSH